MFDNIRKAVGKYINKQENEIGSTGTQIMSGYITDDYISDWTYPKSVEIADEMRKSDATVKATLKLMKLPILAADFFVQPATDDKKDEEIAEFVQEAVLNYAKFKSSVLPQALLMYEFGFSCFEKVYTFEDGKYYAKLKPRLPKSLDRWVESEESVEPGMIQSGYRDNKYLGQKEIPGWKLVRFTLDQEGDNYEGNPLTRSMYRSWFYKSGLIKIGAIAAERGSVGLPTVEQQEGGRPMSEEESTATDNVLKNVRANEAAYLRMPSGYKFHFATPGTAFDFHPQLYFHDRQIAESVLGQFIKTGQSGSSGGYAQNKIDIQLFLMSLTNYAEYICERMNDLFIKDLVDLNFEGVKQYPKLKFSPLDLRDIESFSTALDRLVTSGTLTADVDVENLVRREIGVPEIEEKEITQDSQGLDHKIDIIEASDVTNFPKKGDNSAVSLRNSNHKQFDYGWSKRLRDEYPEIWRKGGNIRGNSAFTNWGKARTGKITESVKSWIREREAWAARHKDNKNLAGVVAQVKWGVIGSRGESYMKNLINDEKKRLDEKKKLADDGGNFRELTLAEEKLDIDAYRNQYDKGEQEMADIINSMGVLIIRDVMKRVSLFWNEGKFGKMDKETKDKVKEKVKELASKQLEQYEWAKTETIKEIGESGRISTPKEIKDAAKSNAQTQADKLQSDAEETAKFTANSGKEKNANKGETMEAIKATLAATVERQADLFGGLKTGGMINRAKRDVHVTFKEKVVKEQYSAILDNRTTKICRSLDGRVDKPGKLPVPPTHANCRSTIVSVLADQDPQPELNPAPQSIEDKISVDPFRTKTS